MTVHELAPWGDRPTWVWLTKLQAAARVQMHPGTIDRARLAGELESSGGGGYAVRIRSDKLDEWLERRGRDWTDRG